MSRVAGNRYNFFSGNLPSSSARAVITGDFQWTPERLGERNPRNIQLVGDFISEVQPNFIIIPGDLVESTMYLKEKQDRDEFAETMKRLTDERAAFWIGGNHDGGMVLQNGKWVCSTDGVERVREVLANVPNMHYVGEKGGIYLNEPSIIGKDFKPVNIHIGGIEFPVEYYIEQKEKLEDYLHNLEVAISMQGNEIAMDNALNIFLIHDIRKLIILVKQGKLPKELLPILKRIHFLIGGHNHNLGIPNIIAEKLGGNDGAFAPSGELLPTDGRGTQKIAGIDTLQVGHVNFTPSNKPLDTIWGRDPWADVIDFIPAGQYPIEGLYKLPHSYYKGLRRNSK